MGIKTVTFSHLHAVSPTLGKYAATIALTALCSTGAFADISIEDRNGARFSLDVRDEPIAKVMDKLAERFDFSVDGYPEHWSDDPMNFSATGDLERVLRSLLKDTSHVFEYHTNADTNTTRIAALKLLNEGVAGFMANQPSPANTLPDSPSQSGVTPGTGNRQPGRLADRASRQERAEREERDLALDSAEAGAANTAAANQGPAAGVSGLSASLAARARQSSATPTPTTSSAPPVAAPVDPSVPNADMQALTQKALQDVQGLAEALKRAEGK